MTKKKKDAPVLPGKTAQKQKGHSVQNVTEPPSGLSVTSLAKHFGVNRRTASDWIARGCPRTSVDDAMQWRARNLRADRQPLDKRTIVARCDEGATETHTLQEKRLLADTAKIEAEVHLKNLRLQERMQNLVSRSAVLREVSELVVRVKVTEECLRFCGGMFH